MILIYKMEGCPYCDKVLDFLEGQNIDYKILDISERINQAELMNLGGKMQVPYLYDANKKIGLYESDDIIEYIDTL